MHFIALIVTPVIQLEIQTHQQINLCFNCFAIRICYLSNLVSDIKYKLCEGHLQFYYIIIKFFLRKS